MAVYELVGKTLTNVLPAFNTSDYTASALGSYSVSDGIYTSIEGSSTWPTVRKIDLNCIAGHVYYFRSFGKFNQPDYYGNGWVEFHDNANWDAHWADSEHMVGDGTWEKLSFVYNCVTAKTTMALAWALPVANASGSPYNGLNVQWKEPMFIDLTAAFGTGNEPDQQWCNENIPYFTGTYMIPPELPEKFRRGDILNCPYSGSMVPLTLPKGKYQLECWGGQGGYRSNVDRGGKGGYASGALELTANTTLFLYSGGSGNTGGTAGGFNGGGSKSSYPGGGGGTDVRIAADSLYARVIVAGGGGSDGSSSNAGGAGGGENGVTATGGCGSGGGGGTQTAGGSGGNGNGTFGAGSYGSYRKSGYGGAGGGGWYGGGGVYPDGSGDDERGGGGGSGYVYTESTASNYPTGCLLTRVYYLTETQNVAGDQTIVEPDGTSRVGHIGDGYIRITVAESGIPICLVSSPSIVPGTVETQEAYTISVTVTEVFVELTGTEAAFEFPFENRYLDLFDLIVEEVTYEIQS